MNYKCWWVCFVLLINSLQVTAQAKKTFLEKYESGKQLLLKEEYNAAKTTFQSLMAPHKNNTWRPYAFYFHALADFNLEKYDGAEKTLLALFGKFPKWENGDEALYLLANIAFERKEDNIALSYTSKIRQTSVQAAADQMKGYYLNKRSISALKNLQSVYPKDEFIAQLLVDKIAAESVTIEDVRFGEALARIYKLQTPTRTRVKIAALPERDTIFVGVILPFNLSKVRAQNKPPLTQMSVEMYQAMRVAKRDLDTTGVKVKLVAYDIKDNPDTLKFMAKEGEFDNIDLFVGPIFEEEYEVMLKVAKEQDTYVINPVLNNEEYQNHQQAFLLTPTLQTQGKQTAHFAKKQWAAQKAIIFHSDLPDDIKLAKAHQEEAKKQGVEIVAIQQITTSKLNQIEEILAANTAIDYVMVASPSQVVAREVIDQMTAHNIDKPILADIAWKSFQSISKEKLSSHEVHFIAPEYIKGQNNSYDFKRAYNRQALKRKKLNNLAQPSIYAFKGYDVMQSFVRVLYEHPDDFLVKMKDHKLFQDTKRGFSFDEKKRDNQYVPILKYEEERLMLVNPLP